MRYFLIVIFYFFNILFLYSQKSNYDHVNVFIGTQEQGHTFPGACVPFGMVQLSPDTDTIPFFDHNKYNKEVYRYCAGYQYGDKTIVGFSHTHFSGTGHSDLGDFLVMPTVGNVKLNPGTADQPETGYRSRYEHESEYAEPGYYKVVLKDYNVKAELTTTQRVGFHRYTFPESDSSNIIMDLNHGIYNYPGKILWSSVRVENDTLITGYRITTGWARTKYLYFAMSFSKPFKNYGCSYGSIKDKDNLYKGFWRKFDQNNNFPEPASKDLKLFFNFKTFKNEEITIKFAISSVSTEGALLNLIKEIPHNNFDRIRKEAKQKWENELNKIRIDANEKIKTIFYTCLYHTLIHPNLYNDVKGNYRGIDNNLHDAVYDNYTTFSLWDTYRAQHPLLTITHPEKVSDMINSMIAHYEQSVHKMLPVWSHHGNENWCMIGYHAVSVIADAVLKDIKGFDRQKAYKACINTSNNLYYEGLPYYLKLGYVPEDKLRNSASITLEYAYDDFCISRFAETMHHNDVKETFLVRSSNYKNIFDNAAKFIRPKNSDGTFRIPFNPLSTKDQGFIEGNSWNYSLYVPHDINGLINLLGSKKKLVQRLDSLFEYELENKYFEHTEDISKQGIIGSYVHGNEPSHHVAYMYNWTDEPWKSQEKIHRILQSLYQNTNDGLCGNDDCGQMSAWYIFSAMGFYPVCPGTNEYVFGSPIVNNAEIRLSSGKIFNVIADNLSEENIYIKKVFLNGVEYHKTYLKHSDIKNGGELIFEMDSKPNKDRGLNIKEKPFSISDLK